MRYKHIWKAIAILAVTLSFITLAHGQTQPPRNSKPCHENPRPCLTQMKSQLSLVRAYVKRVKPGDKVTFNPQPDPPGEPNYRRAMQAYRNLQEEISDLSTYPPGPCKAGECRSAIDDAQAKFDRLGQVSDRNSASSALTALSINFARLSRAFIWFRSGSGGAL